MSSPNQTPDPPTTLEGINKQISELAGRIDSLLATYSDLAEKLVTDQKQFLDSVKARAQSNKPAWIAACAAVLAALIAAIGVIANGQMTAQTNAALTRFTTLQTENAKRALDIYYVAQGQSSEIERDLKPFC